MDIQTAAGEVGFSARKARALLAYLALRPGVAVPRETLAGLLWGERGEEQARASLRQTLSALRKALGKEAANSLIATNESVTLVDGGAWVDIKELEQGADASSVDELIAAADLYRGGLLEGLTINETGFEHWVSAERQRARTLISRVLSRLVELLEQENRIEEAITHGARLLVLDPLQEQIHRTLMRLYMVQGRHDAALSQFEQCRRELADQLDVRPEQATLDLAAEIKSRRRLSPGGNDEKEPARAWPAPAPAPPLPDKPSIAVLPFTNMSADPEQEFFSDGITEDIIIELSRFGGLFVIARNSSFVFKGEAADVREVGRALGVQYVLEGSVRKAGNRIRVTAQLIDAATLDHVWAERYDRDLIDIFELQDNISRMIVTTLAGRLEEFQTKRSVHKPTNNLSAYECVLRGQKCMQKYSLDDYARAREYFEQAIALDKYYARAHAWLACVDFYSWAWSIQVKDLNRVFRHAERAHSLDDHDSRSHLALGLAYLFRNEDHNKAKYHYSMAGSLNPNDDLIMIETGRFMAYAEDPMDGAEYVRRGMRRNPYHPNWYWNTLARCLHTAKDHQGAITALERIDTKNFWNHAYLAACYAELGQSSEATLHSNLVLSMNPDFTLAQFEAALPYRDPQVLDVFMAGLRRAGLPE